MKTKMSSNLYAIFGIAMMVVGVVAGIYFGLWWAFIGGIIDIVNALKADDIVAFDVAIGLAKIVFASVIGWASFALCFFVGKAFVDAA